MRTPDGYAEMIRIFGDLEQYLDKNGKPMKLWEDMMRPVKFPLPIPLAWDDRQLASRCRVHSLLADVFDELFMKIYNAGYWNEITDYGGAYYVRRKIRNSNQWSTHSWGIAIDLNVNKNPYGKPPDQHEFIVKAFEDAGFEWGGRWKIPDGMHFQYVHNY